MQRDEAVGERGLLLGEAGELGSAEAARRTADRRCASRSAASRASASPAAIARQSSGKALASRSISAGVSGRSSFSSCER